MGMEDLIAGLDFNSEIGEDPLATAIELNVMSWMTTCWKGFHSNYLSHSLSSIKFWKDLPTFQLIHPGTDRPGLQIIIPVNQVSRKQPCEHCHK